MRRTLLAPLTLPLLLALAACGGKSGGATSTADSASVLRDSVSKTAATSSKVDFTVDTVAGGATITSKGTGAFDGGTGEMTLTVAGKTLEERITGGTLYLQVPGREGWYVLKMSDIVGTSFQSNSNPGDAAAFLLAADKGVTKVGSEKVRGAETTHYKGSVPLDEAHLSKIGGVAKTGVQKLVDSGTTAIPFDAWVDDQGRLVKLTENVEVTVSAVKAKVTTTLERYDFGTKVDVVVPPKSEQHDGSPLIAALKAQSG